MEDYKNWIKNLMDGIGELYRENLKDLRMASFGFFNICYLKLCKQIKNEKEYNEIYERIIPIIHHTYENSKLFKETLDGLKNEEK